MKTLIKKIKSKTANVYIELPENFVNKDIRAILELDENKAEN